MIEAFELGGEETGAEEEEDPEALPDDATPLAYTTG